MKPSTALRSILSRRRGQHRRTARRSAKPAERPCGSVDRSIDRVDLGSVSRDVDGSDPDENRNAKSEREDYQVGHVKHPARVRGSGSSGRKGGKNDIGRVEARRGNRRLD